MQPIELFHRDICVTTRIVQRSRTAVDSELYIRVWNVLRDRTISQMLSVQTMLISNILEHK